MIPVGKKVQNFPQRGNEDNISVLVTIFCLLPSKRQTPIFFCRFISRQDLISWKAKLDYEVMPGLSEEVGKLNIDFVLCRLTST